MLNYSSTAAIFLLFCSAISREGREVNMVVANNDKPCVEVKTDSMIYCFNYNDEMQTKDLYNRICMLSKQ